MLRVAICDDYRDERELILSLIDKYKADRNSLEVSVRDFSSGGELLMAMEAGQEYDLLLLDILMPEMDGIRLAKKLRKRCRDIPMVFLTSSPDYSLEAFGVWAAQYLLKPITENMLFPVLDKVYESLEKRAKTEESYFVILTTESIIKAPVGSIIYVENIKRVPHFFLDKGNVIPAKRIRGSFAVYLEPLLKDSRFVSPHTSFIINLEHVNELTRDSFSMQNGARIPIPRYRYAEMKSEYFSYLSKRGAARGSL